jgi:hypothetical protein
MSTMWADITTSRRQGRVREDLSGGSPSAKVRADGQKSHRRPGPRVSQHNMTKPTGCTGQGKCGGCALKVHVLIRGELSDMRSKGGYGSRTEGQGESAGIATGPYRHYRQRVRGQPLT